jgi:hypothetical protein
MLERLDRYKHSSLLRKSVNYVRKKFNSTVPSSVTFSGKASGLYYKCVTIVIDAPSVVKVMLQIVASLTIVIELSYASVVNYIYSTGVIYDRHLRSSKYVYNTGHRCLP